MKRVLIIVCLLLSLGAFGQDIEVSFDSKHYDFGTIEEDGGEVSHTFQYVNNSNTPFIIIDVQTTCGCTTSNYSTKPTLKGENGEITILFDPTDRPGRNAKQITLYTNQGNLTLRIFGMVNPRERTLDELYPFSIGMGGRLDIISTAMTTIEKGTTKEFKVGVANSNTSGSITMEVDKSSLPKEVEVVGGAVTLAARQSSFITLRIKGNDYGSYIHTIYFKVNGKRQAEGLTIGGVVQLNISAMTESEFNVQPYAKLSSRYIKFGQAEIGMTIQREVSLTNDGNAPLKILKIEGTSTLKAHISQKEIAPGQSATITLSYSPSIEGYDSQKIRLFTNDPRLPLCDINTIAEVLLNVYYH